EHAGVDRLLDRLAHGEKPRRVLLADGLPGAPHDRHFELLAGDPLAVCIDRDRFQGKWLARLSESARCSQANVIAGRMHHHLGAAGDPLAAHVFRFHLDGVAPGAVARSLHGTGFEVEQTSGIEGGGARSEESGAWLGTLIVPPPSFLAEGETAERLRGGPGRIAPDPPTGPCVPPCPP